MCLPKVLFSFSQINQFISFAVLFHTHFVRPLFPLGLTASRASQDDGQRRTRPAICHPMTIPFLLCFLPFALLTIATNTEGICPLLRPSCLSFWLFLASLSHSCCFFVQRMSYLVHVSFFPFRGFYSLLFDSFFPFHFCLLASRSS